MLIELKHLQVQNTFLSICGLQESHAGNCHMSMSRCCICYELYSCSFARPLHRTMLVMHHNTTYKIQSFLKSDLAMQVVVTQGLSQPSHQPKNLDCNSEVCCTATFYLAVKVGCVRCTILNFRYDAGLTFLQYRLDDSLSAGFTILPMLALLSSLYTNATLHSLGRITAWPNTKTIATYV